MLSNQLAIEHKGNGSESVCGFYKKIRVFIQDTRYDKCFSNISNMYIYKFKYEYLVIPQCGLSNLIGHAVLMNCCNSSFDSSWPNHSFVIMCFFEYVSVVTLISVISVVVA